MEDSAFDAVTQRLTRLLSRRRSLGLLAGASLGTALLNGEVEARKKHKKHKKHKKTPTTTPQPKTCTGCTACETCVNGVCQPLAEGAACGANGACTRGACAQRCASSDDCPDDATYTCARPFPYDVVLPSVCAKVVATTCVQDECASSASCPAGQVCGRWICEGDASPKPLCLETVKT